MSRYNSVRFIKVGLDFDWFEVENWDDVENDIKLNYCDTSMNIGREDDVIIEWVNDGGKVYLKDEEEDYYEFECGFGNLI